MRPTLRRVSTQARFPPVYLFASLVRRWYDMFVLFPERNAVASQPTPPPTAIPMTKRPTVPVFLLFVAFLVSRVAFSSILESVRGTPFPMPRAFFRTGVTPRVALSVLPPAPPAAATMGPDGGMVVVDGSSGNNGSGSPWSGGRLPSPQQQQHHRVSGAAGGDEASGGGGGGSGGSGGLTVGEKRQRRDGGVGAKYYGPSCRLRTGAAEAERSRRPRLPLMSAPPNSTPTAAKKTKASRAGGGAPTRNSSSPTFSASETWWAQTAREEISLAAASGGLGGGGVGSGNGGWRAHTLAQMGSPGVWLLQGTVCRGRGAGGALPGVSEVNLCLLAVL